VPELNEDFMNDATPKSRPTSAQFPTPRTIERKLEIGFLVLAMVLGFFHVWSDHHYLRNADAMSYLDVAEAYLRRDWSTAINAYWGPLYCWLIALTLWITKPSAYWKFAVIHLLNFVIYLFAFACFRFLIHQLIGCLRKQRSELLAVGFLVLHDWELLVLGYSVFIWSSVFLVTVQLESPDMLVASFVYLAAGIVLRIRGKQSGWVPFVFLGIVLGFGYLSKAIMLPISFLFMIAAVFSSDNLRRAVPRITLTVVLFMLLAGPFILALSRSKGRLTAGETGKLAYFWSINQIPNNHWQGEQPGSGVPKHPTRKIFDNPSAFEFGEPVGGTYPVWYDPTYWYKGSVRHFDLRGQLRVSWNALKAYYDVFNYWGIQYGLLIGLLVLYLMGGGGRSIVSGLIQYWILIIPAVAGLGLYALVAVERRYIASFIVLIWLVLFSAVRLRITAQSEQLLKTVVIVLVAGTILTTAASSMNEATLTVRQLVRGEDAAAHEQWQVAEGLREMGLAQGDRVAAIGDNFRAFWAQLLGLKIVAEVRRAEIENFWKADSTVKREVINAFARTGVKAVVVEKPPIGADLSRWQRIRETDYYVYMIRVL
jgi:hypothetical protein